MGVGTVDTTGSALLPGARIARRRRGLDGPRIVGTVLSSGQLDAGTEGAVDLGGNAHGYIMPRTRDRWTRSHTICPAQLELRGAVARPLDGTIDPSPSAASTRTSKALSACIADQLQKAGESAKSIDGLANGDGKDPKVNKAATACATKTQ